jgi:hypothetical protein
VKDANGGKIIRKSDNQLCDVTGYQHETYRLSLLVENGLSLTTETGLLS